MSEALFFALHGCAIALLAVLLRLYARDCRVNPRLPEQRRAAWANRIYFANAFAIPLYWWHFVRPARR